MFLQGLGAKTRISLDVASIGEAMKQLPDSGRTPFRLNPLHDLEPLFWIMVYCSINKDIYPVFKPNVDKSVFLRALRDCAEKPDARSARLRIQRSHAMSLFSGLATRRGEVLCDATIFP